MKSHELKVSAHKAGRRAGRGISAGRGKTAGRGTKGQNARSGGSRRPGFEGGQNPLIQRLPKLRGFKSKRTPVTEIYTAELTKFGAAKVITHKVLAEAGKIENEHTRVKIVNRGELDAKVAVELDKASDGAIKAIEKAGGTFKAVAAPMRAKTEKKKTAEKSK